MKISKDVKQKIILVTIFVILGNFILVQPVTAKSFLQSKGGKLLEPMWDIVVFLGDSVINGLQTNFLTEQRAIVQANSSSEKEGISGWAVVKIAGGALAMVAGVATIIASFGTMTAGGIAAIAGGIASITGGVAIVAGGGAIAVWGIDDTVEGLSGEYDLPMIAYTPYSIFSNTIPIFDINFFSPNERTEGEINLGEGNEEIQYVSESSASILQQVVSSWYYALRNIAIVGLMSILVYIGIRIIIGSASDKAKYKERLRDWLVAMCLIFVMHYLMVFIVTISQNIGNMFASNCAETILVKLPKDTKVNGEQLQADENTGYPIWACNFIGYSRLIAGGFSNYDTMKAIEFTLIYLVLVIYTVIFTVIYLKRVLYMAFLTIIAPLMAMTYPIDKINDGKAQGFDTWLKEYIFNALLQPFHMLIYSIVISSVMNLAMKYPIYAVVALGFLIPAEKMLRKMFGFEKAQSPSSVGALGVAGAGMLMSGINQLSRRSKRGNRDDGEKGKDKDKIKMKEDNFDTIDTFANENNSIFGNEEQSNVMEGNLIDRNGSTLENNNLLSTNDSISLDDNLRENNIISGNMGEASLENNINNTSFEDRNRFRNNTSSARMENKPKKKLRNRLGNGIMAVGTRYSRKFSKAHPLRSLRRGITYGLGAATLGTLGLAAGIASGDMGKALQYTSAAGIVGGNLARGVGDSIATGSRNNFDTFKQGWYGTEYQDKVRERQIKELQANPDNIQYLRERMSNYKEVLREAYPEYAKNGCTNIEDFYAAYKLEQEGATRDSAISTYKLAKRTGDITLSPDAEGKWQKRLDEEFRNTQIVKARMETERRNIENEYKKEEAKIKAEYEKQYKLIENSKIKSKEEKFKEIEKQRQSKYKEMEKRQQERTSKIEQIPSYFSKSALENVKQFYRNK